MYPFAKMMALFWTFAEGMILLYLRWGYLRVSGRASNQIRCATLCSMFFGLLVLWMVAGDTLAHRILSDTRLMTIYRWGTWNFFCTLWVGLEGAIMIFVLRIYKLLLSRAGGEAGRKVATIIWPLLFLFVLYHFAFFETVLRHGMPALEIYNGSVFYVRLCGFLWIAFEWVVAVYGLKTFALLKREEG